MVVYIDRWPLLRGTLASLIAVHRAAHSGHYRQEVILYRQAVLEICTAYKWWTGSGLVHKIKKVRYKMYYKWKAK